MARLVLRPPEPGDARALAGVWYRAELRSLLDSYPDGYPPEWFTLAGAEQDADRWRHAFLAEPGARTWVAEREGVPVGFSQAGRSDADPDVGVLRALYVDPAVWGSGAGSALHDAALAFLAERCARAVLWVIEGNVRTRAFYERRGWVDAFDFMRVEGGLPLVRYDRRLP